MPAGVLGTQKTLTKSFITLKMILGFSCREVRPMRAHDVMGTKDIISGWGLPLLSTDPTPMWFIEITYLRECLPPAVPLHPGQPFSSLSSGQH